jgi:hypothetical protein
MPNNDNNRKNEFKSILKEKSNKKLTQKEKYIIQAISLNPEFEEQLESNETKNLPSAIKAQLVQNSILEAMTLCGITEE